MDPKMTDRSLVWKLVIAAFYVITAIISSIAMVLQILFPVAIFALLFLLPWCY